MKKLWNVDAGDKLNRMYKTYSQESHTDLEICDAGDKLNNMYKTYSRELHTDLEIVSWDHLYHTIVIANCLRK